MFFADERASAKALSNNAPSKSFDANTFVATSDAFCRTVASSIFVFWRAPSAPSLDSEEKPSVSLAVSSLSLRAALRKSAQRQKQESFSQDLLMKMFISLLNGA